jgi:N-acetyl-anhydromuramyl-L-alanine amidase AmpD
MRLRTRLAVVLTAGVCGVALAATASARPAPHNRDRQADFTAAAAEFGVPVGVLLAVSYDETDWEAHDGRPSTTGAYGPMALVDLPATTRTAKGDGAAQPARHTLTTAATLIGADPTALKTNDGANIRGGAALLASYAVPRPATIDGWYDAVSRYGGAPRFADTVFATIRAGAARHTDDGQDLVLSASPQARPRAAARSTSLAACPPTLSCTFVPAAYAQTGPSKVDYGNYDLADRPARGLTVNYIVLHDTEESLNGTITDFQNPNHFASANYVVDGVNGTVTQMVPNADVAWHAGNWYVNMHAIGIEQVGFAVQGATWFTEPMYHTTATLVRYLAARYGVRIDRQHIIGHDNVPGISPAGIPGMHWDPGPFWNWGHFMNLLGRFTVPTAGPDSQVVTVNPVFAGNVQTVTDCEQNQPVPAQPAGFVYLRTAPNATAPLFGDPGLHSTGTTCAADWGDKASTGQQFAVAGRQGDWIAIWWDGAKVWFEDPAGHSTATPTSTFVVRPRPGLASIPTYGVAYPDPSDYPAAIPPRTVTPLPYAVQSGQSYVLGGATPTDYYYAQTIDGSLPGDRTNVIGTRRYLEIQLGHRIAFVKASDVQVMFR